MAYNSSYNPDALPAHAEPEQAAALLSSHQPPPQDPRPPRRSSAGQQYQRRQSPNQAQYDQYNRPHPPPSHEQDYPPSGQSQAGYGRGAAGGQTRGYGYPQGYGGPQNYGGPHARGSPNTYNQSPPPQNYGFSQPPQQYHNRPSPVSRPPPTPAPGAPPGGDSTLFRLFKAVDKDGQCLSRAFLIPRLDSSQYR
ncbi:MAG: hypothetical protein M1836_003989 [Candelina mexicana]|nr:MAG: hypothetical protein M1836_003989 [Candelina mexicana]